MFADDILGFWEIASVVSLRKACSELHVLLQTLRNAGMTINADKSVALLGLAGIKKARALKEHTVMVKQTQYLQVDGGKEETLIPMVEVVPYLGIRLSYGQFEAQTVQHRIEQAVTRFNVLSSVLRTTSKFSAANRARIYKCCVWASLRYGLFATGLNQAGFNRIVTTLCIHLRKVLRIHEHGVSNQRVLQQADLDPMQFFVDSGSVLLERISSDNTRPSEIRDIEKTSAEENLSVLQAVMVNQPHSPIIETDPAFIQGGCVCQTCGLTFASEAGLAMHVKSKHSEIHVKAGVEFNRGLHSLHGVPICRLCRRHLHDWSSMAKHVTAGTCPRLKESLAQGLSHDELLLEVMEQEKLDPPSMPVPMQEVVDIGEYAEWMDAPIEHLLQDYSLHRRLKSGCAICKQRLVGISRVKTHWQLSHKAAWDKTSSTIRGSLRSLSSVFRSPCQFCGSRAKDTSAHAMQCPVMYQALAIRELHSVRGMADARKESTPTRARQDKANPQYMRFDVAATPLGRAFGWSCSSTPLSADSGTLNKKAGLLHRPLETTSLEVATVRPPAPTQHGASERALLMDFCLVNPHSLCYVNSSILALLHIRDILGLQDFYLDSLRQEAEAAHRESGPLLITELRTLRRLAPGWHFGPSQQDAAEFSSHVLERLEGMILWQSRIEEVEGIRITDTGAFLFLTMPTSPSTLQELIEAWTFQHHVYGLTGEWPRIPVVLGRYAGSSKNQARVTFDGDVTLPVFGEGRLLRQARYQVGAALIHLGERPTSGHYRPLLRAGSAWYYSDDARPCARTDLTREHACNVYLLWLVKRGM